MAIFTKAARIGDVKPGGGKVVEVNGTPIALFNVDGVFHAVHNVCLHRGGPIGEGVLAGCVVTCPWHGWEYDVTTGVNLRDPRLALSRYSVKIEGDDIYVEA